MKVPVLMSHKRDMQKATGLTLAKVRELGWKWLVVEVPVPDVTVQAEVERLDEQIKALIEERVGLRPYYSTTPSDMPSSQSPDVDKIE